MTRLSRPDRTWGSGFERGGSPALATLRERFARGEIDTEEYEERRGRLAD